MEVIVEGGIFFFHAEIVRGRKLYLIVLVLVEIRVILLRMMVSDFDLFSFG